MRQGGLRDAILHSVGSNATHGLRRTNADKRRAVSILLQDELVAVDPATGSRWSDREVARRCSVGAPLVATVRSELTVTSYSEPTTRAYRDRHGNVTQMDTARIGRRTAEPEPASCARRACRCPGPAASPRGRAGAGFSPLGQGRAVKRRWQAQTCPR